MTRADDYRNYRELKRAQRAQRGHPLLVGGIIYFVVRRLLRRR